MIRVPSTLLCYTVAVPTAQHSRSIPAELNVHEEETKKAAPVASLERIDLAEALVVVIERARLGQGGEQGSGMSDRISHKRPQRQAGG